MRKFKFIFLFLFANQFAFGQSDSIEDYRHVSEQQIIAVSAGRFYSNFSALNSQLKMWGTTKIFLPLNTYGITATGTLLVSRNGTYDAAFSFDIFSPQEISIGDSLKYRLYGWHLMTSVYGYSPVSNHWVALVIAPGVDWGTAYITGNKNGNETHFWNPFISPFARTELRFIIWRIALGVRASYRYDVSKKNWKQDSNHLPALPNSKFTGLGLQFFIGYGYPGKK